MESERISQELCVVSTFNRTRQVLERTDMALVQPSRRSTSLERADRGHGIGTT